MQFHCRLNFGQFLVKNLVFQVKMFQFLGGKIIWKSIYRCRVMVGPLRENNVFENGRLLGGRFRFGLLPGRGRVARRLTRRTATPLVMTLFHLLLLLLLRKRRKRTGPHPFDHRRSLKITIAFDVFATGQRVPPLSRRSSAHVGRDHFRTSPLLAARSLRPDRAVRTHRSFRRLLTIPIS